MRRHAASSGSADDRTFAFRSGRRGGFTLVEVLIVVAIIAILAATVIAEFHSLLGMGKAEAMSATVTHIRQMVELKAAKREEPLAPSGFPALIDPDWFQMGHLPYHTWTGDPMIVENVDADADQVYPAIKTFDTQAPGAENAWYNRTNGVFCVRVGHTGNDAKDLEAFNTANHARATDLNQTTQ